MKRNLAIVCAALIFPLSILTSLLVGLYFKSVNPDNIDITQGLAYLGYAVYAGLLVALCLTLASFVFALQARKLAGQGGRLPFLILIATLVIGFLIVLLNLRINQVQNTYLKDHGRPTLDEFFKQSAKQKQNAQ